MQSTGDGSYFSSKIPLGNRNASEHLARSGLYRGIVLGVVAPDNPQNSNKERYEYKIKVNGQVYPNAIVMKDVGGIFNYSERVVKETERALGGEKIDKHIQDKKLDGEAVFVMFMEGNANIPVIVGFDTHPRRWEYKKSTIADGRFQVEEFNGIEIRTDKDGNYKIKVVGLKRPDGSFINEPSIGTEISIVGHTINILSVHPTPKAQLVNIHAGPTTVTLTEQSVAIKTSGPTNITSGGSTTLTSGGTTTVNAPKINLAGGGPAVARVGDTAIGSGNLGFPVISTIVSGSGTTYSG